MGNYYATSRSNYVQVKDVQAVKASMEQFGNIIHQHSTEQNFIMIEGGDDAGFSTMYGEEIFLDWRQWVMEHLVPGQTLVLIYVGNEKLRYLAAGAEAYTWDGRCVCVDMKNTLIRALLDIGVAVHLVAMPEYQEICQWKP